MKTYHANEGGPVLIAYRIVKRLRKGPVSSRTLMDEMWLSRNAAMRHLNAAHAMGLVERRVAPIPRGGNQYVYEMR
jgi:predicted transcriptional regulator